MNFRVGIGQDSHRFSTNPQKKLFLGGCEITNEFGFEANSDGDVLIHALCNAIEQALGNQSFSRYADLMCQKGITDSQEYLKVALEHLKEKNYRLNNVGITIEGKKPKIEPFLETMKKNLASLLEIASDAIGINATTGEELTPFGKGKGVQVLAIVSLIKD